MGVSSSRWRNEWTLLGLRGRVGCPGMVSEWRTSESGGQGSLLSCRKQGNGGLASIAFQFQDFLKQAARKSKTSKFSEHRVEQIFYGPYERV